MHVVNGEIYGLVGPNGAGKSTMLKMLLNLTKPDMGEFTIDGVSVQKMVIRHYVRLEQL